MLVVLPPLPSLFFSLSLNTGGMRHATLSVSFLEVGLCYIRFYIQCVCLQLCVVIDWLRHHVPIGTALATSSGTYLGSLRRRWQGTHAGQRRLPVRRRWQRHDYSKVFGRLEPLHLPCSCCWGCWRRRLSYWRWVWQAVPKASVCLGGTSLLDCRSCCSRPKWSCGSGQKSLECSLNIFVKESKAILRHKF